MNGSPEPVGQADMSDLSQDFHLLSSTRRTKECGLEGFYSCLIYGSVQFLVDRADPHKAWFPLNAFKHLGAAATARSLP